MAGEGGARAGVVLATVVVHLGLALAIIAICAEPVRALVAAVRGPVTFADEVPSPAWLAPVLFAVVFAIRRIARFVEGVPLALNWTWAALVVLGATLAGRALTERSGELAFTSIRDAPPAVQTAEVLRRLHEAIDAAVARGGTVPPDAELQKALAIDGVPLLPNYRYAGLRRRPFQLKRVDGLDGPVDRKLPGDLAGTLYVAVSRDQRHYWLTALVLLDDNGVRSSDLMPGATGVLVITNSLDGR